MILHVGMLVPVLSLLFALIPSAAGRQSAGPHPAHFARKKFKTQRLCANTARETSERAPSQAWRLLFSKPGVRALLRF
jgi:hypothetical protein